MPHGNNKVDTMQQKKDAKSPATTSAAYDKMTPKWNKMNTILEGTEAMRQAGETYLPKHPEETQEMYNERCQRAVLLNMVEQSLEHLAGKPFTDPIKLEDDVPEKIVELMDDVDLQGNSLDVFARNWFESGMSKALCHVFVDQPALGDIEGEDGKMRPRTLADDKDENVRPYWTIIEPENLLFASSEMVDGKEVITHIRFREDITERVGFAEVVRERIRVVEPGKWEIWEKETTGKGKTAKDKWVKKESGQFGLDFIPLVTFYADREGFMFGKPPLADLADLNIAHWQSDADQRHVLTVARFPILAVSGALPEGNNKKGKALVIGPDRWLQTPDPQGKFYYVEHSGAAIAAGRTDMLDLEEKMASYGASFLKRRPGNPTATGKAIDSSDETSDLEAMALSFKSAIETVLEYTAAWLKLDEGGHVTMKMDFGLSLISTEELNAVEKARARGDISRVAFLNELQRRGVLSDEYDIEDDLEQIEQESMDGITGGSDNDMDPLQEEDPDDPKKKPEKEVKEPEEDAET